MKNDLEQKFKIKEEDFFIHFPNDLSFAVIMAYRGDVTTYFKVTGFASDVVKCLSENKDISMTDISEKLSDIYSVNIDQIKAETQKVIKKLEEHSIL